MIRSQVLICGGTGCTSSGSDEEKHKSTIVSLVGIDKSRELVDKYTSQAIAALHKIGGNTKGLSFYAMDLAKRVR